MPHRMALVLLFCTLFSLTHLKAQGLTNNSDHSSKSLDKKIYAIDLPERDTPKFLSGNTITAPDNPDGVALMDSSSKTLPVEWLEFTATQTGLKTVTLDWTTASESNKIGFNIERSVDGVSFEKIGHLQGADNSSSQQSYRFLDQHATASRLYYLLEQVDAEGVVSYSEIRTVKIEDSFAPKVYVYPNPASQQLIVKIEADPTSEYALRLMDMEGKTVYQSKKELAGEEIQIAISSLPSGMYALVLTHQLTEEMISAYFWKK